MDRIPLFGLRSVLFPHTDLGIHVFEPRYRTLVAGCLDDGTGFGVVAIRRGNEVGGPADPYGVGTSAVISAHARLPDGRYLLEVEGSRRFRIMSCELHPTGYLHAEVRWLEEPVGDFGRARQAADQATRLFTRYMSLLGAPPQDMPSSPILRSYRMSSAVRVDLSERQQLLDEERADVRLGKLTVILRRELALLDHIAQRRGEI